MPDRHLQCLQAVRVHRCDQSDKPAVVVLCAATVCIPASFASSRRLLFNDTCERKLEVCNSIDFGCSSVQASKHSILRICSNTHYTAHDESVVTRMLALRADKSAGVSCGGASDCCNSSGTCDSTGASCNAGPGPVTPGPAPATCVPASLHVSSPVSLLCCSVTLCLRRGSTLFTFVLERDVAWLESGHVVLSTCVRMQLHRRGLSEHELRRWQVLP